MEKNLNCPTLVIITDYFLGNDCKVFGESLKLFVLSAKQTDCIYSVIMEYVILSFVTRSTFSARSHFSLNLIMISHVESSNKSIF